MLVLSFLNKGASFFLASAESNCWWQRLGIKDTVSDLGGLMRAKEHPSFRVNSLLGWYLVRAWGMRGMNRKIGNWQAIGHQEWGWKFCRLWMSMQKKGWLGMGFYTHSIAGLGQQFSKCSPQTTSGSIIWELVREANSLTPPPTYYTGNSGAGLSNLCYKKSSRWLWYMLKSANYCFRPKGWVLSVLS